MESTTDLSNVYGTTHEGELKWCLKDLHYDRYVPATRTGSRQVRGETWDVVRPARIVFWCRHHGSPIIVPASELAKPDYKWTQDVMQRDWESILREGATGRREKLGLPPESIEDQCVSLKELEALVPDPRPQIAGNVELDWVAVDTP